MEMIVAYIAIAFLYALTKACLAPRAGTTIWGSAATTLAHDLNFGPGIDDDGGRAFRTACATSA